MRILVKNNWFKRMVNWFSSFRKKKPKMVILHCSATNDSSKPGSRWYELDIAEVRRWHVEDNGWSDVGYHFFIKRDGTLQAGRPVGTRAAACLGYNDEIQVCYAGRKYPTAFQKETLVKLCRDIEFVNGISADEWRGHYEFANKECPGFKRDKILKIIKGE